MANYLRRTYDLPTPHSQRHRRNALSTKPVYEFSGMEFKKQPQSLPPESSIASTFSATTLSLLNLQLMVEFNGSYSLEKLYAFQTNSRCSIRRQALVICAVMLPALVVALGLKTWPLENASLGWERNWRLFVRETVRTWVIGVMNYVQLHEFVPELRQPWIYILPTVILLIAPHIASIVIISEVMGVFPVPMSTLMTLIPAMVVGLSLRTMLLGMRLNYSPEIKKELRRFDQLSGFIFSALVFYCAYGLVFTHAGTHVQLVLSLALYVFKDLFKYIVWKLSHIQDHHDFSAESVYSGTHLFHTFFAIAVLQNARSLATFGLLLVVALAHGAVALYSIHQVSKEVHAAARAFLQVLQPSEPFNAFDPRWTAEILHDQHQFTPTPTHAASARHHQAALNATQISPIPIRGPTGTVRHQQTVLVQSIAHVMHCREAMLLRMFVDIYVPVIHLAYVGFLVHRPTRNLPFFSNLAGFGDRDFLALCLKLSVPLAFKLASFDLLCALMRRHGQPSGVAQLAFVVASQRWTMQSWFVVNILQVTSFQLAHMGNDLSFRFAWLHKEGFVKFQEINRKQKT